MTPRPHTDGPEGDQGVVDRVFEHGDRSARFVRRAVERVVPAPLQAAWRSLGRALRRMLPKGLLARSLLIIVVPMVIFQTLLAYVFMERHWQTVTARLSAAVSRDIAAVVDLVEALPAGAPIDPVADLARRRLSLDVRMGAHERPLVAQRLGFSDPLLQRTLTNDLGNRIEGSFSVETGGNRIVTITVETSRGPMSVQFNRNLAYAANWHIFLVWMIGIALVLTFFSAIFLRNQIRPILRLANAAEAFGRGRPVGGGVPQGAREVRRAWQAFIAMRRRIERQIEQRTTMLAGVGHDLRTMLTRLRLQLALMPPGEEADAMARDIDEMNAMLEAYMAFANGEPDEEAAVIDVEAVIEETAHRLASAGRTITTRMIGDPAVVLKASAFRRLVGNLVGNAARYGRRVEVTAEHLDGRLTVIVDDDGPGIPQDQRDAVFRPFFRLDTARNQDHGGTGLGLAIARDVARAHAGDVRIEDSPLGGARAIARLSV
jgi:two-component system, OmpR family, osmolarity sensor histidine kinase EnvZ